MQGLELKRVSEGDEDDEMELWAETNGWGHGSDEAGAAKTALPSSDDVSMETWVIMELCNRGSLQVRI